MPLHYDPLNDPFGYMPEIPDWDKMTDEERDEYLNIHYAATMKGCLFSLIGIVICILLCLLFGSCTTTRYVPVTETHTEHHWHTDSMRERDSTHTERETVIREVDSAAMAQYGIQMESNQRAWLVLQREMENRLRELEHMTAHKDTVRDTIPQPYEVVKEVPRQRSKAEWALLATGLAAIVGAFLYVVKKVKPFLPGL